MRKLFNVSMIASISLIAILQFSTTSCTKETITEIIKKDTVTIIQKDTIVIKDTPMSLQILTAHQWKLQEIRGVMGASIEYYVRGGANNTINYDLEYIVFRQDKTGTYYDANGYPSALTWNFANTDNTKLVYTVNFPIPGPTTVTWENITYKNGMFKCDQYWSQGNIHAHEQLIRIPK